MNVSLYQAASALNANNRWQELIGDNLASTALTGYKKQDVSFEAVAAGLIPQNADAPLGPNQHYSLARAQTLTDFTNGELTVTGEETDLGLEGAGFFEIQLPNGSSLYTRSGSFQMDVSGQLITKAGYAVMGDSGPIQLDPRNPNPIVVSDTGEIRQGAEVKGQLRIVDFNNPQLLTLVGGNYFAAADPNLFSATAADPRVRQGFLEASNTSAVHEMANLITAMRNYQANQKVIQTHDERMSRAISELGAAS